jgi:hypothetical protein
VCACSICAIACSRRYKVLYHFSSYYVSERKLRRYKRMKMCDARTLYIIQRIESSYVVICLLLLFPLYCTTFSKTGPKIYYCSAYCSSHYSSVPSNGEVISVAN